MAERNGTKTEVFAILPVTKGFHSHPDPHCHDHDKNNDNHEKKNNDNHDKNNDNHDKKIDDHDKNNVAKATSECQSPPLLDRNGQAALPTRWHHLPKSLLIQIIWQFF